MLQGWESALYHGAIRCSNQVRGLWGWLLGLYRPGVHSLYRRFHLKAYIQFSWTEVVDGKTYNLHTKVYPILDTSHKYNMITTTSVEGITMNGFLAPFVFLLILTETFILNAKPNKTYILIMLRVSASD